ncbi:MAG: hypothetical protein LUD02_05585 [Tannerellaceae bacterium]|nr:hypothetical protein [Tannerellaceae bacterium]MCD8263682.1 hypothetical protein [Tannerellaceae bacterium]
MDFIVLHLSPRGDSIRFEEAQKITAYIRESCPDHVLVMGDFNSSSPFDADEMEQKPLRMQRLAASAARNSANREMRHFFPDYSVQSTFLATPLADVYRLYVKPANRTTMPTRMLIENSKREDLHAVSGGRIDYILLSYPLLQKCVDAFIWNGEDTDYLSDHYPVGVDMVLLHETE